MGGVSTSATSTTANPTSKTLKPPGSGDCPARPRRAWARTCSRAGTYGDGWLFSPTAAFLDALVKKDGDVTPCEGKVMLRMGTDTNTCATSAIYDPITVKGNTQYQLIMQTRATAGVTAKVRITQDVTVYPSSDITLTSPINTGGWVKSTWRFTTHAKCTTIRIRIENPTGLMYVDDVTLGLAATTTIHPAEGIYENSDCEDKQQLLDETKAELERRSVPTVSYEADILTFARSCTDLNNVGLGDRVLLVDTTFTPDLRLAGRVLQLEEDLLDPALTTVTIGNIIERFTTSNRSAEQRLERVVAESAAWNTSSQQISQNAGKWDQVAQTVVDNAPHGTRPPPPSTPTPPTGTPHPKRYPPNNPAGMRRLPRSVSTPTNGTLPQQLLPKANRHGMRRRTR